jgi:hypothetical protein
VELCIVTLGIAKLSWTRKREPERKTRKHISKSCRSALPKTNESFLVRPMAQFGQGCFDPDSAGHALLENHALIGDELNPSLVLDIGANGLGRVNANACEAKISRRQ